PRTQRAPGGRARGVGRSRPATRARLRNAPPDGPRRAPRRRDGLLDRGLVRDVRQLDDRRGAPHRRRARGDTEGRSSREGRRPVRPRAPGPPGPNQIQSQAGWPTMSVCTSPDRTAGAPGADVAPAAGPTGDADGGGAPLPRMFKPPAWEWTGFGEVGWWVRAGSPWRDVLLGPDGLRLEEWRAAGCVSVIKSGPHRVVYRVALPEGTLFIKHYLVPNRRAILRQWFRRGKGRNEGKRSQRLAAIGVPTIWPIALGERRKRKFLFENYLVTPEIP